MDCLFCFRGFIKVQIVDDEEYEKNEVFYIELFEPELYRPNGELRMSPPLSVPLTLTYTPSLVYYYRVFCL